MNETLQMLRKLQEADTEILRFQSSRDALQDRLNQLNALLVRGEAELQEKQEKVGNVESFYEDKQSELKENMAKAIQAKNRLTGITKQKEYLAAQKEIEYIKKVNAQKEEETSKLLEAIQEYQTGISADQEKLSVLRSELEEEQTSNSEKLSTLTSTIDGLSTKREDVSEKLGDAVLRKYQRVLNARNGIAVVPVIEETCSGCNMRIPPQQYIQLLQSDALMNCAQCQRFVFVDEKEEAALQTNGLEVSA